MYHIHQASWKCKLRDRIKTLRRPGASSKATNEPSAKRPRLDLEESYDRKVESLQEEMKKRKKNQNIAVIQSLTLDTFAGRRSWIQHEQPPVIEIVEKFPSLKLRKVVSKVNVSDFTFLCTPL